MTQNKTRVNGDKRSVRTNETVLKICHLETTVLHPVVARNTKLLVFIQINGQINYTITNEITPVCDH